MARGIGRKYPRYTPVVLRPPGAGAFFDYAAAVAKRHAVKLESSSLVRRWGKAQGALMDWESIAANWAHYKSSVRLRWGRFTEAELDAIGGRRGLLAAHIERVYGISANAAQTQLESWQGVQQEP